VPRGILSFVTVVLIAAALLVNGCRKSEQPSGAVDVEGIVSYGNVPVSGVNVAIPGVGSTTTGADGSFTFAQVTPPYDIAIASTSDETAVFFRSLHTASPRLGLFSDPEALRRTASVSGTLSSTAKYLCLDLDDSSAVRTGGTSLWGSGGGFDLDLWWIGPEDVSSASEIPDATYLVLFSMAGDEDPFAAVMTPETSITLPDLASVGLSPIPRGVEITWSVTALIPLTMDDVVSSGDLGLSRDHQWASPPTRKFTIAP
jgi:hypothetical protein